MSFIELNFPSISVCLLGFYGNSYIKSFWWLPIKLIYLSASNYLRIFYIFLDDELLLNCELVNSTGR